MSSPAETSDRSAAIVGKLLLWSSLSGVVMASLGALVAITRGETLGPVRGRPLDLLAALGHLRGSAIAELGLLVLMATPVLRVLTLTVAFALEKRDRRYALASALVLVLLAIGMALGRAG